VKPISSGDISPDVLTEVSDSGADFVLGRYFAQPFTDFHRGRVRIGLIGLKPQDCLHDRLNREA
jgi:hypothetical protein